MMWVSAGVTAALDVLLYFVLAKAVSRTRFAALGPYLAITAAAGWCAIYTWAARTFWDTCYGLIFSAPVLRYVSLFGIAEGLLLGWLFWWIAGKAPLAPTLAVGLLAALQSLPGHMLGIFGRQMLDKCTMLVGVNPVSALVFGLFEFAFYWAVFIAVAALLSGVVSSTRRILPRN